MFALNPYSGLFRKYGLGWVVKRKRFGFFAKGRMNPGRGRFHCIKYIRLSGTQFTYGKRFPPSETAGKRFAFGDSADVFLQTGTVHYAGRVALPNTSVQAAFKNNALAIDTANIFFEKGKLSIAGNVPLFPSRSC